MIDSELLFAVVTRRADELRAAAERSRLLAPLRRPSRPIRLRRGGLTVEIHLSPDLRPEQVDQVFASLARHLGTTPP
jgi:hypothetical protein